MMRGILGSLANGHGTWRSSSCSAWRRLAGFLWF